MMAWWEVAAAESGLSQKRQEKYAGKYLITLFARICAIYKKSAPLKDKYMDPNDLRNIADVPESLSGKLRRTWLTPEFEKIDLESAQMTAMVNANDGMAGSGIG